MLKLILVFVLLRAFVFLLGTRYSYLFLYSYFEWQFTSIYNKTQTTVYARMYANIHNNHIGFT